MPNLAVKRGENRCIRLEVESNIEPLFDPKYWPNIEYFLNIETRSSYSPKFACHLFPRPLFEQEHSTIGPLATIWIPDQSVIRILSVFWIESLRTFFFSESCEIFRGQTSESSCRLLPSKRVVGQRLFERSGLCSHRGIQTAYNFLSWQGSIS